MVCPASAAGVISTIQVNDYVNVLEKTSSGENINSCKGRTHLLKKIRSTNPLSSLRRKKNGFRVVLQEEPKFHNWTFFLEDPGVKKGRDWKLKDDFRL